MSETSSPSAVALVEIPDTHRDAVLLGDTAYRSDPAAVFRSLRHRHGPVAPVLLDGGVPVWLVLGHREIQHITSDSTVFARRSDRWRLAPHLPPEWPLWPMVGGGVAGDSLLYTEGEAHQRRASAMSAALRGVDHIEFRARCGDFGEHLVNTFAAAGEAELMSAYALPLPAMATGWALGVDPEDIPELVEAFLVMLAGGPDAAAGQQRGRTVITDLVQRVRVRPGANVASRLAADPAALSDSQLVEDLLVAIIAAHQTTAYWMGNAARLMLTATPFTDTFSRGRLPVGTALHEVLWDDTPTQVFAGRWTTCSVPLGDYLIPEGDLVLLGLAAANTDPHIRPDPAAGVCGNRSYLSYSHGPHGCPMPARDLAETIATTGIEILLDRLPDLHLACKPDQLRWQPMVWMRGLAALPVQFTPTSPATRIPGGSLWT
ncbi:cytochrome P450 [Streptomyces sp. NPDC057654]|uniref:cytochrome P450 n=1 Tax=Streptomyces sp. NPDC057654 TaxID=3346196 RepID=UPI0036C9287D